MMAEEFGKGGQRAWFHDHGHWGGFFHTYDRLQLSGFGEYFDQPRKVHVFIPRDYEISQDRYPVVYCNDGDNIFFADGVFGKSWQVAELLSRMYLRDQVQKLIVVAICPVDRTYEYSHVPHDGGGLEDYGRYLAKGLKPFIDDNYRTQTDQSLIVGSSRGGLAAFYAATQHPQQFPQVAALSPAFWLGLDQSASDAGGLDAAFRISLQHSALIFAATPVLMNPKLRPKIYLDWGLIADGDRHEERAKIRGREMKQLLTNEFGYQENLNLFTIEDPIGKHDEESWGKRLEMILKIFF
jgi:hypothetical protein